MVDLLIWNSVRDDTYYSFGDFLGLDFDETETIASEMNDIDYSGAAPQFDSNLATSIPQHDSSAHDTKVPSFSQPSSLDFITASASEDDSAPFTPQMFGTDYEVIYEDMKSFIRSDNSYFSMVVIPNLDIKWWRWFQSKMDETIMERQKASLGKMSKIVDDPFVSLICQKGLVYQNSVEFITRLESITGFDVSSSIFYSSFAMICMGVQGYGFSKETLERLLGQKNDYLLDILVSHKEAHYPAAPLYLIIAIYNNDQRLFFDVLPSVKNDLKFVYITFAAEMNRPIFLETLITEFKESFFSKFDSDAWLSLGITIFSYTPTKLTDFICKQLDHYPHDVDELIPRLSSRHLSVFYILAAITMNGELINWLIERRVRIDLEHLFIPLFCHDHLKDAFVYDIFSSLFKANLIEKTNEDLLIPLEPAHSLELVHEMANKTAMGMLLEEYANSLFVALCAINEYHYVLEEDYVLEEE